MTIHLCLMPKRDKGIGEYEIDPAVEQHYSHNVLDQTIGAGKRCLRRY